MAYGYEGDATADSNSLAGIGDRDNHLSDDPEHRSAALTVEGRQERFGVTGKSTGKPFEWNGQTYYDNDTAPTWFQFEGRLRHNDANLVDVYDPSHPPDNASSANATFSMRSGHQAPRPNETYSPRVDPRAYNEAPAGDLEQKPTEEEPKEENTPDSPARARQLSANNPLSPDNVAKRITQLFPQYGKFDSGQVYQKFVQRYDTGLKQILALYPKYQEVPKQKLLAAIKNSPAYKNYTQDEFIDRFDPPKGFEGAFHSAVEQLPNLVKGWYEGTAQLAKFPDRMVDALNRTVKALGITTEAPNAKVIGPGGTPIEVAPAPAVSEPAGQPHITGPLFDWAKHQAERGNKYVEKARIAEPHDLTGKVTKKILESTGAAPAILPAFIPGIGTGAALVLGMTYDGIQQEAEAREKGIDSSLLLGAEGLSYRAVQEWLLRTPRGRLLSAVYWAAGGVGDEAAQNFLSGKPSELGDLTATAATNALFGAMFSAGPKKMPPAAREIFFDAVEQQEKGNYREAARLVDRSMLLLSDTDRKAVANNLLAWRDEAIQARPGKVNSAQPGERGFMVLKGKLVGTGTELAWTNQAHTEMRSQDEKIYAGYTRPPSLPEPSEPAPPSQQALSLKTGTELPYGSEPIQRPYRTRQPIIPLPSEGMDGVTDQFYYSGLNPGAIFEAVRKFEGSKTAKSVQEFWDPEKMSSQAGQAATVMGKHIAQEQVREQQFKTAWYKQQKLENDLQFAYETDQRHAFWLQFPRSKLMQMAEDWNSGSSTGNKVADRLYSLHDGFMRALARRDQANNFRYNIRDNNSYFYGIFEDPEGMEGFANAIRGNGWGDPDFMHPKQIPTIAMAHSLGFKLKTYNPEEWQQLRLNSSLRAEMRASILEGVHDAGLAVTGTELKQMPLEMQDKVKSQSGSNPWRSPRMKDETDEHETYWVHKDADFMLHRGLDPLKWHKSIGWMVNTASSLKQRSVGMNLGWSLYHQVHMLDIGASDTVTHAMGRLISGTGDPKDWGNVLADVMSGGVTYQLRAVKNNQRVLNWYRGIGSVSDFSPYERKMHELQEAGGFTPLISEERQVQIARNVLGRLAGRGEEFHGAAVQIDKALSIGYAIGSAAPYQKWLFNTLIPSMKMYSYNQHALALLDAHPEFNRPNYKMQRDVALRKIRNETDAHFGEQNLRLSFTDGHFKALGQAVMLSYSWFKSFVDTYGGGAHDLSHVVTHFDEVVKTVREEGARPAAQKYFTRNLQYVMTLSAMTYLKNMLISQLLGAGVQSLADMVYPNIGYDKDGKLKRVKPPYWVTTEIGGLAKDIDQFSNTPFPANITQGGLQFMYGKLQPFMLTLARAFTGKDYNGADISPHWDPTKSAWENFESTTWPRAEFVLTQMAPFTVQQLVLNRKPDIGWRDAVLALCGIPPAPAYAERDHIENMINQTYADYHTPKGKEFDVQQQSNAKRQFREDLKEGDTAAQAKDIQKMKALGLSDKQIANVRKTKGLGQIEAEFKQLTVKEQVRILMEARGDERQKYLGLAKKDAKTKVLQEQ